MVEDTARRLVDIATAITIGVTVLTNMTALTVAMTFITVVAVQQAVRRYVAMLGDIRNLDADSSSTWKTAAIAMTIAISVEIETMAAVVGLLYMVEQLHRFRSAAAGLHAIIVRSTTSGQTVDVSSIAVALIVAKRGIACSLQQRGGCHLVTARGISWSREGLCALGCGSSI